MFLITHNNGWLEFRAKNNNKRMHSLNGNPILNDLKILQFNTRNGGWAKTETLLKFQIDKLDPDIISISESNTNFEDIQMLSRRRNSFKNYIIHDKIFQCTKNARLTVLVKADLDIIRLIDLENQINPVIILKIKTAKNKNHILVCNYRQWKGTSPQCNYNSRLDSDCIARFKQMLLLWRRSCKAGARCTIIGDINIDRLPENDPSNRPDLKNLIPLLLEFRKTKMLP